MAETDGPRFACPSCGRSYRWKPELAGRTAKCKCGGAIRVPAEAPDVAAEAFEAPAAPVRAPVPPALSPPAPARSPATAARPPAMPLARKVPDPAPPIDVAPTSKSCPSCGESIPAAAVLCVACGYDFRTGKRLSTTIDTGSDDD